MAPILSEVSTGTEGSKACEPDPLCKFVRVALAVYLTPVVAIVCAIGGAAILFDQASRVAGRLMGKGSDAVRPVGSPTALPGFSGLKPLHASDRRRIRV